MLYRQTIFQHIQMTVAKHILNGKFYNICFFEESTCHQLHLLCKQFLIFTVKLQKSYELRFFQDSCKSKNKNLLKVFTNFSKVWICQKLFIPNVFSPILFYWKVNMKLISQGNFEPFVKKKSECNSQSNLITQCPLLFRSINHRINMIKLNLDTVQAKQPCRL